MITLVTVGQVKDKNLQSLASMYLKRLQPYHQLKIIEVKDYNTSNKNSLKQDTLTREAQNILKVVKNQDFVILLSLEGQEFDSIAFSEKLESIFTYNSSNIVFIIGGSMGVSTEITKRANLLWKFSDLTFPHQLFRVMLLEQIYRSFKIKANEPYHK